MQSNPKKSTGEMKSLLRAVFMMIDVVDFIWKQVY